MPTDAPTIAEDTGTGVVGPERTVEDENNDPNDDRGGLSALALAMIVSTLTTCVLLAGTFAIVRARRQRRIPNKVPLRGGLHYEDSPPPADDEFSSVIRGLTPDVPVYSVPTKKVDRGVSRQTSLIGLSPMKVSSPGKSKTSTIDYDVAAAGGGESASGFARKVAYEVASGGGQKVAYAMAGGNVAYEQASGGTGAVYQMATVANTAEGVRPGHHQGRPAVYDTGMGESLYHMSTTRAFGSKSPGSCSVQSFREPEYHEAGSGISGSPSFERASKPVYDMAGLHGKPAYEMASGSTGNGTPAYEMATHGLALSPMKVSSPGQAKGRTSTIDYDLAAGVGTGPAYELAARNPDSLTIKHARKVSKVLHSRVSKISDGAKKSELLNVLKTYTMNKKNFKGSNAYLVPQHHNPEYSFAQQEQAPTRMASPVYEQASNAGPVDDAPYYHEANPDLLSPASPEPRVYRVSPQMYDNSEANPSEPSGIYDNVQGGVIASKHRDWLAPIYDIVDVDAVMSEVQQLEANGFRASASPSSQGTSAAPSVEPRNGEYLDTGNMVSPDVVVDSPGYLDTGDPADAARPVSSFWEGDDRPSLAYRLNSTSPDTEL